jgi:UDPglucose 6-dehydrogenase
MKIGFIGLGKLGLPVALAIESKGHDVVGYDISEDVKNIIDAKKLPYREIWAQECLDKSKIKFVEVKEVVNHSEIIFVPIQTPHHHEYEGITRLPDKRIDFDYSWLKSGIKTLSDEIEKQKEDKIVVIISTVLPGTIRKEIMPLLNKYIKLCYNPFFIAMGTTIQDFLNPEFVLLGMDSDTATVKAEKFYKTLHSAPLFKTSIESAELIKVVYNTFISTKISFINTVMEICHKLPGVNVDDVTDALELGTDRIISSRYMRGGMGDGGGCHPRDNIALSWLARKLDLSYDWFENIMMQREKQTEWLVSLIEENLSDIVYILGKAFKPETNIVVGSPSILLKTILEERGHKVVMYDPWVDKEKPKFTSGCYFIGTKHPEFKEFKFPKGSIVLDPWRYIPDQDNINVIRIGE